MTVSSFRSCPPGWSALDQDPPLFASPAWLTRMGDRVADELRWFLYHSPSGEDVGFFGGVHADSSASEAKNPWRLVFEPCSVRTLTPEALAAQAQARATAPEPDAWFPSLILTYPGLECFPLGPGRRSPAALDAAIAGVESAAQDERLRSIGFLYVQPEEPWLAAALRRAGFIEVPLALRANLNVPGRTFGDYLAMLSGDARKGVRKIRNRLAARAVEIRRSSLRVATDGDIDRLVELRLQHRAKYGRRHDEAGERSHLEALRSDFGDLVALYAAVADDRIIGFSLFLEADGIRHAWMTGTDYADERSRDTYFELSYYTPIEDAYRLGASELSFSYGVEEVKLERGAHLDEVVGFVRLLDPAGEAPVCAATRALRGGLLPPSNRRRTVPEARLPAADRVTTGIVP